VLSSQLLQPVVFSLPDVAVPPLAAGQSLLVLLLLLLLPLLLPLLLLIVE
jgi:hypothetical protein